MKKTILFTGVLTLFFACKTTQVATVDRSSSLEQKTIKYLALGDSYTIGESVCESCSFPMQLMERLAKDEKAKVITEVIAKTGWTTSDLIQGIKRESPNTDHDIVTLLIGVNNQYQGKGFSLFEEDFTALLAKAVQFARGDKNKVFVISIPDYAYTPYGQEKGNAAVVSSEIDQYNNYAKKVAQANGVSFINITDITRQGLNNPELVASDKLHPSEVAYNSFVSEILFEIKKKQLF